MTRREIPFQVRVDRRRSVDAVPIGRLHSSGPDSDGSAECPDSRPAETHCRRDPAENFQNGRSRRRITGRGLARSLPPGSTRGILFIRGRASIDRSRLRRARERAARALRSRSAGPAVSIHHPSLTGRAVHASARSWVWPPHWRSSPWPRRAGRRPRSGTSGRDPFSFYYGYYLPHAAAIAAQPTPMDTINQNIAQRQQAAMTDRSSLYDPVSPYGDTDDDPLAPYSGGRGGGDRARAGLRHLARPGRHPRAHGPSMYYNRTARYFADTADRPRAEPEPRGRQGRRRWRRDGRRGMPSMPGRCDGRRDAPASGDPPIV